MKQIVFHGATEATISGTEQPSRMRGVSRVLYRQVKGAKNRIHICHQIVRVSGSSWRAFISQECGHLAALLPFALFQLKQTVARQSEMSEFSLCRSFHKSRVYHQP